MRSPMIVSFKGLNTSGSGEGNDLGQEVEQKMEAMRSAWRKWRGRLSKMGEAEGV